MESFLSHCHSGHSHAHKLDREKHTPSLDYESIPSLSELGALAPEKLASVQNFTVTRNGYGSITWTDPVDLRHLDPLHAIQIDSRAVHVYPNGSEPPKGTGLNRNATITLYNVDSRIRRAKRNKRLKGTNKDDNERDIPAELRARCKRIKANFEKYEKDHNGTLVFHVEHFSRYGLDSSDESDEDNMHEMADLPKENIDAMDIAMGPAKSLKNLAGIPDQSFFEDDDELDETKQTLDNLNNKSGLALSNDKGTTRQTLLDLPDKIQTGATENFPVISTFPLEPGGFLRSTVEASRLQMMNRLNLFGTNTRDKKNSLEDSPKKVLIEGENADLMDVENTTLVSITKPISVSAYDMSKMKSRVSLNVDKNICMDRSFRFSFGSGFIATVKMPTNFKDLRYDCVLQPLSFERNNNRHEPYLSYHIEAWESSKSPEQILNRLPMSPETPSLALAFRNSAFLKQATLEKYIQKASSHHSQRHEEIVFRLMSALYIFSGDIPAEMQIRQQFSTWLEKYAIPWTLDDGLKSLPDNLEKLFYLLTQGKVEAASSLALDLGNPRLALLIASAWSGTNGEYRKDIYHELIAYQTCLKSDNAKDIIDIMKILGGNLSDHEKYAKLSWYSAFGVYFWFSSCEEESLDGNIFQHACDLYDEAWQKKQHIAPPVPPYNSQRPLQDRKQLPLEYCDISYYILNLFCKEDSDPRVLEKMFSPQSTQEKRRSHTEMILSWHVYSILRALTHVDIDFPNCYKIHLDYAYQLDNVGMPLWSVYVLCCMKETRERDILIRNWIIRMWPRLSKSFVTIKNVKINAEEFLLSHLGVPKDWLSQAQILWSRSTFDQLEEIENLINLSQQLGELEETEASDHVLNEVNGLLAFAYGPAILSRGSNRIYKSAWTWLLHLLEMIGSREYSRSGAITDWRRTGYILQIILDVLVNDKLPAQEIVTEVCKAAIEYGFILDRESTSVYFRGNKGCVQLFKHVMSSMVSTLERRVFRQKLQNYRINAKFDSEAKDNALEMTDFVELAAEALNHIEKMPMNIQQKELLAGEYAADHIMGYRSNWRWQIAAELNYDLLRFNDESS